MELSKADRKAAREIIEKGLQKEYEFGLLESGKIIDSWKNNMKSTREAYLALYAHVESYDKHIARRYDEMKGSRYLLIIAHQLIDKVIDGSYLKNLSPEACNSVKKIVALSES